MRRWLASKLFDLATRLDWDGALSAATAFVLVYGGPWAMLKKKKKIGRPLGSRDKKPRKNPVRKVRS